ncbi:hypothetical protein [Polaromonas sp. LjRoot131]|uniref:hypothetical protein n=1 Tax=Polaromonas sp. LjRoot131 TaxID=3342262 RepID=UPI003ECE19FE
MAKCVVLASRQAMLEDARAVMAAVVRNAWDQPTLVLAGELAAHAPTAGISAEAFYATQPDRSHRQRKLKNPLLRIGLLRSLFTLLEISRRRREVDRQLAELRPDVLLVFEDRVVHPEMVWLDVAARRGIPALLVRYASSSAESDAWTRRGKTAYSLESGILAWARRRFARLHPRHEWQSPWGRQLFYSLWDGSALALAGMAGLHPWVVGGGKVAAVAVQGEADLHEALALCDDAPRFHVTGQPSWDSMADRRLQARAAQGLAAGRKLKLVCALPQWGEHLQLPWPEHMARIQSLFEIFQASQCEVLLSLHPKASREAYETLAAQYGLQVAQPSLSTILPEADIFVASWSSTLRWSAMLGIASVNLDWAGQNYALFSALPSLRLSQGPSDLPPMLAKLVHAAQERSALGAQLQQESRVYGKIDGQAGQRVFSLLSNLTKGQP